MEETFILYSDYDGRKFCVTVLRKTFKLVGKRVVINIFYFQNGPHNVPRKKAINFTQNILLISTLRESMIHFSIMIRFTQKFSSS